jgi:putative Holliday junction resolvase
VRTLAIDYGGKRTGLAMSDEGGRFATPIDVLATDGSLVRNIAALARREAVERVVIGLPMHMDGTAGSTLKQVLAFAAEVASATALAPVFIDERLSSFEAEQQLIDHKRAGGKMTRKMKKERLDALAAAAFLQAFLDGKLSAIDPADVPRR